MKTSCHIVIALLVSILAAPLGFAQYNPNDHATGHNGSNNSPCSNNPPYKKSIEWQIKVGHARYLKSITYSDMAKKVCDKFGNLTDTKEIYGRFFPSGPLQQTAITLQLSQPQISAQTFHPSCLFLESSALFELLAKPDVGGEFIHQILTDDTFTLIELLAPTAPAVGSGFRVRIWRRDVANLERSGAYYATAGFEAVTPLSDVTFKRGATDDNTLLYIQKERLGVADAPKIITDEIVQTLDSYGKPLTVTSKLHDGEGTGGTLLQQENIAYSARGARAWDYTLTRDVSTASVDAAGVIGGTPVQTARSQEVYADFSPPASTAGGDQGMKRCISQTDAFGVPGQTPQTTTCEYYNLPTNPTIHGRLKSEIRPDGSWKYFEYVMSPEAADCIITEYSSWKDVLIGNKAQARKTVSSLEGNTLTTETFVEGQPISKSKMTLTGGDGVDTRTTSANWDGTAWHENKIDYYPDNAAAPNSGRLKTITRSDGTIVDYTYAGAPGAEVATAVDSSGTTVATTYARGGIAIAQTTTDGNVPIESWAADSFDASGRPVKRIYNPDYNNPRDADFEITQYACCGLEFSRSRDGRETTYFHDPLKRVYMEVSHDYAGGPDVITTTAFDGLTAKVSRGGVFVSETTRSLDGLTQSTTGPSQKSMVVADRPTTSTVTVHSATGDTTTTTDALGTTTSTRYIDGQTKSVTDPVGSVVTYNYAAHNVNGGGLIATVTTSGLATATHTDLLGRTFKTVSPAAGTTTYDYFTPGVSPTSPAGSRGKLKSVTDADSVVVSYGYMLRAELIPYEISELRS